MGQVRAYPDVRNREVEVVEWREERIRPCRFEEEVFFSVDWLSFELIKLSSFPLSRLVTG